MNRLVKTSQRAGEEVRRIDPEPDPRRTSNDRKKPTRAETAEMVRRYLAGASLAELKVEHHMSKNTVAKILRDAGVTIRPRGRRKGQLVGRPPRTTHVL
ncbi:hypothetical protein IRT45_05730 [Nocardia sp. BSTN01]|uniref:helix-turn-helix domain-containing protein n=1 Tax=Nocardia sp. BSTN01 TaxID=2783665 RepID=UPI00188EAC49|nr:hypothetical protein [Nocardia sp. BSTN01]MBF4996654.1 hypothetical protein [Nocardia sp. BSTN01]